MQKLRIENRQSTEKKKVNFKFSVKVSWEVGRSHEASLLPGHIQTVSRGRERYSVQKGSHEEGAIHL